MNHSISLKKAIDLTTKYRNDKEKAVAPGYENMLSLSETFDRAAIDFLLSQKECVKFRVYFGLDAEEKMHVIMVGGDEGDNDILPDDPNVESGMIVECGVQCPPLCPPASQLNS